METLIAPIASGIISAIVAAFGCYVAITNRLTRLEAQRESDKELLLSEIRLLRKDVEGHSNLVERTAGVERDLRTAFKRIDENRDEIRDLGKVKIGGTL